MGILWVVERALKEDSLRQFHFSFTKLFYSFSFQFLKVTLILQTGIFSISLACGLKWGHIHCDFPHFAEFIAHLQLLELWISPFKSHSLILSSLQRVYCEQVCPLHNRGPRDIRDVLFPCSDYLLSNDLCCPLSHLIMGHFCHPCCWCPWG